MNKNKSIKILTILQEYYGQTKADLNFDNIYELTIAVVMSAQTTDKQVNSVTPELFSKFPDFKSLSQADISKVEKIIKSTGFYKNKSKNIVNLAIAVVNKFNNILPDKIDELITLPGVGRKSANVILSIGYGKPAIAVDTHVARISNRLGYIESNNPDKIEVALNKNIPEDMWISTHLLFIRHGRELCKARNPVCENCPVKKYCTLF